MGHVCLPRRRRRRAALALRRQDGFRLGSAAERASPVYFCRLSEAAFQRVVLQRSRESWFDREHGRRLWLGARAALRRGCGVAGSLLHREAGAGYHRAVRFTAEAGSDGGQAAPGHGFTRGGPCLVGEESAPYRKAENAGEDGPRLVRRVLRQCHGVLRLGSPRCCRQARRAETGRGERGAVQKPKGRHDADADGRLEPSKRLLRHRGHHPRPEPLSKRRKSALRLRLHGAALVDRPRSLKSEIPRVIDTLCRERRPSKGRRRLRGHDSSGEAEQHVLHPGGRAGQAIGELCE
mmetsp:Transcript_32430/g.109291  ORF Transcript_32430/g.109291 Transcript_32430/m.109291 type:complete len:293 (-) Transcript_32430:1288-2166(-)